jgi:hypothetical protein
VDQRKALDYAVDDARGVFTELSRLVDRDIAAAYRAVNKPWTRPVKAVAPPSA